MNSNDLIQKLHRSLKKQPDGISVMSLAAELGSNPSELQTALGQLKDDHGAPLVYQDRRYYYTDLSFELPGLSMTAADVRSLATVLGLLADVSPGSGELDHIRQQISQLMSERGIDSSELTQRVKILTATKQPVNSHSYQQVSDALFARRQLTIHYVASDQNLSERTVSPQTLVLYRDHWYLDAWCHKRQQLRTFMLSRIRSAYQLNEAALEFDNDELTAHLHNNYGIFSGGETQTAELTFMPGAAHLVAQQQWHPEAKGQWHGDQYQLQLPYNDDRELLRDLLSYAPNVIVTAPEALKAAYRKRLQEALNRNM